MRKGSTTYIKRFIGIALIPIFILLGLNANYNWHYHITPSGQILGHAHPYNHQSESQSPVKSHKHNNLELFLINSFSNTGFLISIVLALAFFIAKNEIVKAGNSFVFQQKPEFSYISRGPPVY